MSVYYVVADLHVPAPHPFAVLAIDTDDRRDGGVVAKVVALHMTREEADRECASLTPHEDALRSVAARIEP